MKQNLLYANELHCILTCFLEPDLTIINRITNTLSQKAVLCG